MRMSAVLRASSLYFVLSRKMDVIAWKENSHRNTYLSWSLFYYGFRILFMFLFYRPTWNQSVGAIPLLGLC
jgi:hypothetical protein